MKKTKFRRLAVMTASLLCCLIFTVPAYAQSNEPQPAATPCLLYTSCVGYTVLLCFTLFKTGSLAKSICGCH